MASNDRPTYPAFRCCGVRIDAVPLDDAALMVVAGQARGAVHLCNAYTLSLATRDPELADVLERGTLNLPDGMPLVWIARRLGHTSMTERVYGPDLMAKVLDYGRAEGVRHFLYGSTPPVLTALRARIGKCWPNTEVVGLESPPFREIDNDDLRRSMDRASALGANVVWVGMGTPSQDFLVERMAAIGDATYVAVGAAFDFVSGSKKQAPGWMQRRGLEWSFRLATEPRRLWRRYLVGNTRFVLATVLSLPRPFTPAGRPSRVALRTGEPAGDEPPQPTKGGSAT